MGRRRRHRRLSSTHATVRFRSYSWELACDRRSSSGSTGGHRSVMRVCFTCVAVHARRAETGREDERIFANRAATPESARRARRDARSGLTRRSSSRLHAAAGSTWRGSVIVRVPALRAAGHRSSPRCTTAATRSQRGRSRAAVSNSPTLRPSWEQASRELEDTYFRWLSRTDDLARAAFDAYDRNAAFG